MHSSTFVRIHQCVFRETQMVEVGVKGRFQTPSATNYLYRRTLGTISSLLGTVPSFTAYHHVGEPAIVRSSD